MTDYASLADMAKWAEDLMNSRPADFVIGDDYLCRWWVIPRNEGCNIYLHHILHSDDDRALHDHPFDNTSMVLAGRYVETTPDGEFLRETGSIVTRAATDSHRLSILPGESAVSLFVTGPKIRDWGFHCPQGWRIWYDFVAPDDKGAVGRGCGE